MKHTGLASLAQATRFWIYRSRALLFARLLAGFVFVALPSAAQTTDLTVDVLINSTNTTGYNTDPSSPGEYQRYPERYLEHLQIPYRVIDVSNTAPPMSLSTVPLIIAAHRGLVLSAAWQQAILSAVEGGTGFVNLDWDTAIGSNAHMQAIFGSASSAAGTPGTSITLPATFLPDGSTPHYITGLQLRWPIGNPASASGNLVYNFHADDNRVLNTATCTLLLNSQGAAAPGGTVLATIGNDALLTATTFGSGNAVNFGTYDFLRADRFGFVMGLDDLFWRSLVWAARKPFVLRGHPRWFAIQQDDPVAAWDQRVGNTFNPAFTGTSTTQTLVDGSTAIFGGPWKVTGNIQTDDLNPGTLERQNIINFISTTNYLRVTAHTVTGGVGGDLYWTGQNPTALTDAQWLSNYNALLSFQQGNGPTGSFNGGNDFLPFASHVIPHFWNFSNNVGADLWNLGIRYITEIQPPGVYYNQSTGKTPSQRMQGLHPYRVYEQPPSNGNPNEIWSFYWADNYTIGSRAGLPSQTFFGFASQLQGAGYPGYPSFDAKWPQAARGIPDATALENWQAYIWRFWSGMAPVQVYNHDGGSMANSTDQERQQFITNLSSWIAPLGSQNIFMDDLGAYLCARVNSTLSSAQMTPSAITLNFTGNGKDLNGNPVTTYAYVFYRNDGGQMVSVPGFSNGTSITVPNLTPPGLALNLNSLSFSALPGDSNPAPQTIAISNSGTGTMNWTASTTASWLGFSPSSGTNAGTLTVSPNTAGLTQGTYTGTLVVSGAAATHSPQSVAVTLVINGPVLSVSPSTITLSAIQGQANPSPASLTISNTGAGTLNWTASTNATWLTLSSASGTAPSTISAQANVSGLAIGTYTGNITITATGAGNSPQTIPVTLAVTGLLFSSTGTLQGWNVSPIGSGSNWSVVNGALQYTPGTETLLYLGNSSWGDYSLTVGIQLANLNDFPGGIRGRLNPSTGESYAVWLYPKEGVIRLFHALKWALGAPVTLGQGTASFDTNLHTVGLTFAGSSIRVTWDGVLVISANDTSLSQGDVALDGSSQIVNFSNILVTGAGTPYSPPPPATIAAAPTSLNFFGSTTGNPVAQNVNITNSKSGTLNWTASTDSTWLNASPASGTAPSTISVAPISVGLATGQYNGNVILSGLATNSPLSVPVSMHVGNVLFSDNFTTSPDPNFLISPMGLGKNWSVANGTYDYNGGGATQAYINQIWTNYSFSANFQLSNLKNYPGGIRARLNPSTGAGYALWFYPATGQIKLYTTPQWNINGGGLVTLATASAKFDTNVHNIRIDLNGTSITVYYDSVQLIQVTSSTFASGGIALDVSNQPIQCSNILVISF
jgi:hypothetical protein